MQLTNEWTLVREGSRVVKELDCSSNTVWLRGFESYLCRLVFKNTWTEFGKHNNWSLPILLLTHRWLVTKLQNWR